MQEVARECSKPQSSSSTRTSLPRGWTSEGTGLDNDLWRRTANTTLRQNLYSRNCFEFLLLGPLFVVFMLLMHTHMSLPSVYSVERVLKFSFLNKRFRNGAYTVRDVHDANLFWEWFESVLEGTLAVQEDQLGHPLPQAEWGYINGFNKVVGEVRLVQDRGSQQPCADEPARTCYGREAATEPFGYPPCGADSSDQCYDSSRYRGAVHVEGNEGFTLDNVTGHFEMWLDLMEPYEVIKRRVEYLEDRHWIDKQTRKVTIELLIRNHQYEPLLSLVLFHFYFDRAGYVQEEEMIETVPADPYASGGILKIVLSACYVGLNFFFAARLLRSWRKVYGKKRSVYITCKRICTAKISEILNLLVTVAQISLWGAYVSSVRSLSQRVDSLERPAEAQLHDGSDARAWDDYHHEIAYIEHGAESCVAIMRAIRKLSALILICFLLRYFRVWEGIPALAVVTKTLSISAQRVGALLTSTVILLILFSGAAMLTYGSQLKAFHCVECAVQETAIIAMTGDPEVYASMYSIDPAFAAIWYWSLIAVVYMVVLNMMLGVLVDAASAAGNDTPVGLFEQLYMTLQSSVHCLQSLLTGCNWCAGNVQSPRDPASAPTAPEPKAPVADQHFEASRGVVGRLATEYL